MVMYLLDTNIVLRFVEPTSPGHSVATSAIVKLRLQGHTLNLTAQNLVEYWAVATRPVVANGLGWTVERTEGELARLMSLFPILPDHRGVLAHWRSLVNKHRVTGKQVHDARLVAVLLTHRVTHLLTFNVADFARYTEVTTVDPHSVV